jgi:hypothetical protein
MGFGDTMIYTVNNTHTSRTRTIPAEHKRVTSPSFLKKDLVAAPVRIEPGRVATEVDDGRFILAGSWCCLSVT